MARIRTTKPEFWTDSKTGTLSSDAKCVFIALWNHVDDYGVIENDPVEIAARILPHRTTALDDCLLRPLQEIARKGLIEPFVLDGKAYLWVRNFTKHQRIKNPAKPLLSDFDKHPTPARYLKATGTLPEPSSTPPGALPEDSILPQASPSRIQKVQGKGKERIGKEGSGMERNGSGVEWNGSTGDGLSHSAPSGSAGAAPPSLPAREPEPDEPDEVLGRDFTLADAAAVAGVSLEPRIAGQYVPPPPDEIEARRARTKAQLEAAMTPEEREEAARIRAAGSGDKR